MNWYWNFALKDYFNIITIYKINLIRNFKTKFINLNNSYFSFFLVNCLILFKNIFKIDFKKNVHARIYKIRRKRTYRIFFFIKYFKNLYLIHNFFDFNSIISKYAYIKTVSNFNPYLFLINILKIYKQSMGDGFIYIRGLFIIFFIDSCVTDDEPLWEPIEWSLIQTWIFFIFIFAWIAENLISSRYGSYTGRDKKIWYVWYKTFWLIEFWYLISLGTAIIFVIIPFYYELTYMTALVFSWWNWYSKIFFFKFISIYTIILLIAYLLLINIKWLNWKKSFLLILIINLFLTYLLYINFIITFFGYFTNPIWYQKNRMVDYIQLSHEPLKWGWGPAKRDHFSYHKSTTVFWFKNDGPFASSFLIIHLFLFLFLFFTYIYWLVLLRKIYTTKEISYTLTTYCISALRQYFYLFLLLYFFVFVSFIAGYWRFPIEFLWLMNTNTWFYNFILILNDYIIFLIHIFI